jgi:hypothetical protein
VYFIPNDGVDPKSSQILNGGGYVTINLRGAHYSSKGNLWEKIFGGTDKVVLSTQVTHTVSGKGVSSASIEEMRQVKVNHPYYFGSGREIALNLPTDCDAIEMGIVMSAVQNDNLSGALNILNSGELKSTLSLAPPALTEAITIAGVVKKLLTNTNPQNSLQGDFSGRISVSPSNNPIRDYCLAQGTIILIYRESADDTSLDDLDPDKLTVEGDGLKYDGRPVQNTYAMFQVSFTDLRGEDPSSQWYALFSAADQMLDGLDTAASDTDKQKLWAAAYADYQQGTKALAADATYTKYQVKGIAATHLAELKKKYVDSTGHPKPPSPAPALGLLAAHESAFLRELATLEPEDIAKEYRNRLARANVSLPGPIEK